MYAIVKTGGKQYRVEEGQSLLVERLRVDDGGKAALTPLLVVDGDNVVDGEDLSKVTVEARVVGHERGPKLRVVKFKPKRGYKRRTGHRQELTRIEVTSIKLASRRGSGASRGAPKPVAAEGAEVAAAEPTAAEQPSSSAAEKPKRSRARKPAAESATEATPTGTSEAEATAATEAEPTSATEAEPTSATDKPETEEENGA